MTIAWPAMVVDSVCWMLSTSVVSTFSYGVVRRPSSSSGFRPVYCQATETTGILMLGKMSVGVREDHDRRGNQDQDGQHDEGVGPVQRQIVQSTCEVPLRRRDEVIACIADSIVQRASGFTVYFRSIDRSAKTDCAERCKRMELRHLRYFCAVAESGALRRRAGNCMSRSRRSASRLPIWSTRLAARCWIAGSAARG